MKYSNNKHLFRLTAASCNPLSITKAIRMENLEQYWEQSFSPIGRKFTVIRPNYQDMGETDSMVAALYWLELEMYNGGFLQFFCNWGYDAYLLAIKGLGAINATYTEQLLLQAYGIIQRLENDSQLQELWDIPKHLTENEITKLNKIDEEYWEDKENIMQKISLFWAIIVMHVIVVVNFVSNQSWLGFSPIGHQTNVLAVLLVVLLIIINLFKMKK